MFACYLLGDIDEFDEIQEQIWQIEKATALQEIYADEVKDIKKISKQFDINIIYLSF